MCVCVCGSACACACACAAVRVRMRMRMRMRAGGGGGKTAAHVAATCPLKCFPALHFEVHFPTSMGIRMPTRENYPWALGPKVKPSHRCIYRGILCARALLQCRVAVWWFPFFRSLQRAMPIRTARQSNQGPLEHTQSQIPRPNGHSAAGVLLCAVVRVGVHERAIEVASPRVDKL